MNKLSDDLPGGKNVCAIILDYFGADKTVACLRSLLDQELDSVLVVDNSGDRQAGIKLQDALAEITHCKKSFEIHLMVNSENLGFGAGMNKALNWLESNQPHQYYLLINNDAQSTPGMVQTLLQSMRRNNKIMATSPVMDTGNRKVEYNWYQRFSGLMFSHYVIGSFPFISGCCLLVDQKIIGNSLFDEDFFMYGEDVELSWRLHLSGYKIACVPQATVRHEVIGSSHQGEYFYEYHIVRGHILLAQKLARRAWQIPLFYFGRMATIPLRAVLRAFRFHSLVPITASLSAICHARQPQDK